MSVSAVIPVYNAGRRLLHALAGVRAQTRPPDEVIVVDDGSTDGSIAEARRLFPEFHYLQQARGGPSAARNRGIAHATREWVAFLDADDHWRADHLQIALARLADGRADAILSNRVDFFDDPDISPVPARGFAVQGSHEPLDLNQFLVLLRQGFYFCQSSVLLRRECIREGYRPGMHWGEDIELFLRVTARGGAWRYTPERTVHYRVDTPGALSQNYAGTALGQFRAFKRIEPLLTDRSRDYCQLVRTSARRALLAAVAYENAEIQKTTWREVGASIGVWERPLIWSVLRMPRTAGALHRVRHQLKRRRLVSRRPDRPV